MKKISDASLYEQVEQVAERLIQQGKRLVTAESCTGGWVAKSCTDLAGSSAWFDRGFVTYSNEAKQEQLGVDADTLEKNGAVSLPVVEEMAFGALKFSRADFSIAITGIAGPGGGSDKKPVGTVWIGWGTRDGGVHSICQQFSGDRESIRRQAVFEALSGLLKIITDH
jgi:nicotinamide-nucleotide amidase